MCMVPISVNDTKVPCGKCPECKRRRVSAWSFRLMQEEKRSLCASFVTLTYDTDYVPITQSGFMSLDRRDVQLFLKRLRKCVSLHSPNVRLKYYLAGEYGGKTSRPHYHIILFNCANLYDIERSWMRGSVHYGTVSGASVGYTLKYLDKPKRIPMHRNDDRLPEFGLMSKGLGTGYLTEKMLAWHHADLENRCYLNLENGTKCSMPRYYKDKIYTEEQRKAVAESGRLRAIEQEELLFAKYNFNLPAMRKRDYEHKMKKFQNNFKKDKL